MQEGAQLARYSVYTELIVRLATRPTIHNQHITAPEPYDRQRQRHNGDRRGRGGGEDKGGAWTPGRQGCTLGLLAARPGRGVWYADTTSDFVRADTHHARSAPHHASRIPPPHESPSLCSADRSPLPSLSPLPYEALARSAHVAVDNNTVLARAADGDEHDEDGLVPSYAEGML